MGNDLLSTLLALEKRDATKLKLVSSPEVNYHQHGDNIQGMIDILIYTRKRRDAVF